MRRILLASTVALAMATAVPAQAGINPFVGDVMLVSFTFCPQGWVPAEGQTLLITQHTTLFSLLGTNFGGDGTTNFKLPDFRGQAPGSNQVNAIYCIAIDGIYPSR